MTHPIDRTMERFRGPTRKLRQLMQYARWYGPGWGALRLLQWPADHAARWLTIRIKRYEEMHGLRGPGTQNQLVDTVEKERWFWDNFDWANEGHAWTRRVEAFKGVDEHTWERLVLREMILEHAQPDSVVLEIGPGSGRWSTLIQPACRRLILVDISPRCIDLCRRRLHDADNVEFNVSPDGSLTIIDDESVDAIWAYGVFVEFDEVWAERLLSDLHRVLRRGGVAMIHHRDFAPYVDAAGLERIAAAVGLQIIEQNFALPAQPGEVISVARRDQDASLTSASTT